MSANCNRILLILAIIALGFAGSLLAGDRSASSSSEFAAQDDFASSGRYQCESDLVEVMFDWSAKIRFVDGQPNDLTGSATAGLASVTGKLGSYEWSRICDVPEEKLDEIQSRGEANTGKPVYNLNNIVRLRIPQGLDVWDVCKQLEALPGVMSARPVPKPTPSPWPGNYEANQVYLDSSGSTPSGIDAEYAWTQSGGTGTAATVCDLEYGWNYNHADITKAVGSQINPNPLALPSGETDDHGTAVIGMLVANSNAWGITGICYGASLKTCGTFYGSTPSWDVPGALAYAIASLSVGDVILLEQQWDYGDPNTAYPDYIPIEWWTDSYPGSQSYNGVYAAIANAVANGIHVVEAGGNGGAPTMNIGVDTDILTWYGNSGAVIVGAGGLYAGGTYTEGNLQRLSFSSYGSRFDLQGCGENVYTTGYGNLWSSDGKNYYYTHTFAGTSSSAPVVAGAIACCMGRWKAQGFGPSALSPGMLRSILVNTGKAQITPPSGLIGPRPNLKAAFGQLGSFVDATAGPLGDAGRSSGTAWGDYDNDGDLDLIFTALNAPIRLLRNDGSGSFADATPSALAAIQSNSSVAWGDYDNDGDLDLALCNVNGYPRIFRNDGPTTFTNVTTSPLADVYAVNGAVWGDYDNDGDIDLFLPRSTGMSLFRNDGNAVFTDVSGPFWSTGEHTSAAWGDYDNDGDLDIYVACYGGANRLYRNDGGGSFSQAGSVVLYDGGNGTGVAWGDYDNDGDLDIYLTNFNVANPNKLFRNDGGGTFVDATTYPLSDNGQSTGPYWADYDNDGDIDLFMSCYGSPTKLFRNDGGGTFADATPTCISSLLLQTEGTSWGDYDNDGDLDLYLANGGTGQANNLFRNQIGSGNHWLHINLIGSASNKAAIGARVRVVSGTLKQIREISGGAGSGSQCSLTAEFGLGSRTSIDSVVVSWPSDSGSVLVSVPVDTVIEIIEPGGYICGDANGSGGDPSVDIDDVVYLINYIFAGGPAPEPVEAGDADCSGGDVPVDIDDVVYLINYIFAGGPEPCADC
jgi:hypothetical protein